MSKGDELDRQRVRDLMLSCDRKKPQFLDAEGMDNAIAAIFRLAMEVSVLRDRIATHEILAEKSDAYSRKDVEEYEPDFTEMQTRKSWRDDLVARLIHDLK